MCKYGAESLNSPNRRIHLSKCGYRPTVYDTGVKPNDYICPNLTSKKQVSKLRGCIALHTFTTIHTSSHCTLQVFVNFCPILSEFSRFWVNSLKTGQKLTRTNRVHCRQTEKLIGKRESHLLRWRRSAAKVRSLHSPRLKPKNVRIPRGI